MDSLWNYILQIQPDQIESIVETFWIVPVGMLVLYFYGMYHFNTPDYRIGFLQNSDNAALLTLAPPRYTTTRSRFRKYGRCYVLILEVAFLGFIFFPTVFSVAAQVYKVDLPHIATTFQSQAIQSQAILALFCLTGLLSSFPGFKDADSWLLSKLHHAALIPDDAKLMATRLFGASYQPSEATRAHIRQLLKSRDTLRFSDNKVVGALEQRVVYLLCLYSQLEERANNTESAYFATKFEIDLKDIAKNFTRMKSELLSYFREQESLVPGSADDIDQYLSDQTENAAFEELTSQRKDLLERCDSFYYRLCLLTSLLAYATEDTAEAINRFLHGLGFSISVEDNEIMDWETVFEVVGSLFGLMVGANILFTQLLKIVDAPVVFNDRPRLLAISLSVTLQYFVVIYAALKIKRRWRRMYTLPNNRPENPLIAIASYFLALPISLGIRYSLQHEIDLAPFLFATNSAVVGYFIATYIDRSVLGRPYSWPIVMVQAACQFATFLFIDFFAPALKSFEINNWQNFIFAAFGACQFALAGFLVGSLFQYFYRRTAPDREKAPHIEKVQLQQAA
jgi:hypothetical protein